MKKKPASPSVTPDGPYHAAIARHQAAQLNVALTRRSLQANVWQAIAIVGLLLSTVYFAWKAVNTPPVVIASDHGRIIPIPTLTTPVYSDADIMDYGARHIRADFTLDFVHFRAQINGRQDSFSTDGFTSYYQALVNSNVLANVRDKKMNLSVLTSSGVIVSKGELDNGVYAWKVQYPITLRLNGQTSSLPPQHFTLVMLITRADPRLKKDGLEVIQIVTREASAQ
ncbi:DotI/IcmL/TraM family protein [Sodalis endosymbiont of Spalangia cameroni]|uniref:DotI/IcmL/TraM family protein n=1 Tax=Sodalis praecaptivus TaxID=1239307 RepID=UPI0031FA3215